MQRILISGASGLIGQGLKELFESSGHQLTQLVRRAPVVGEVGWDPAAGRLDREALEGLDAVVHLSGANIAGHFTAAHKREVKDSRVDSTRVLCEALAKLRHKPKALICASAIGIYGNRGEAPIDEHSAPGTGFLSEVCTAWEAAAEPARQAGLRVCHVRVGVVLSPRGGALKELLLPFRLGVGGRLGDGRQGLSWVDYDDILGIFSHALTSDGLSGPLNATAPTPVSNAVFTRTLGRVLARPTLLPLPAAIVRGLFGEMGQALLLDGVYARPTLLEASGYRFRYPKLEASLRHQLGREGA